MHDELYMSFATFTYFTNNKNYKVQRHIEGYISFWFNEGSAKHHILQIITSTLKNDCGYVVIDSIDVLKVLFNDNQELIDELNTYCIRKTENQSTGLKVLHCSIEPSRRKDIKTVIHNSESIECLARKP